MKKLLFLLLILFSCEKGEPEKIKEKNTVFMATSGSLGRYVIIRDEYNSHEIIRRVVKPDSYDPSCDSPYDNSKGYWILYLEPGIYELTVQCYVPISPGYVYKTITISENSCNRFDIDKMDQW